MPERVPGLLLVVRSPLEGPTGAVTALVEPVPPTRATTGRLVSANSAPRAAVGGDVDNPSPVGVPPVDLLAPAAAA
jgi:hypothetical protein